MIKRYNILKSSSIDDHQQAAMNRRILFMIAPHTHTATGHGRSSSSALMKQQSQPAAAAAAAEQQEQ